LTAGTGQTGDVQIVIRDASNEVYRTYDGAAEWGHVFTFIQL